MGVRKWLMKQQWRLTQIRGIWGLFYSILLLAVAYVEFVPYLNEMGSWGPFLFAGILLFIFVILGFLYDKVFQMWAPAQEVTIERNPYQYVPLPTDHIFWFPIYSTLLDSLEKVAETLDVESTTIDEVREYYSKLQVLKPQRKDDIDKAVILREAFARDHPFSVVPEDE
ncbi:MAG: hypothetical protein RTU30_09450 [Candidatus Thorarchaeota archaeon]